MDYLIHSKILAHTNSIGPKSVLKPKCSKQKGYRLNETILRTLTVLIFICQVTKFEVLDQFGAICVAFRSLLNLS